MNAIFQFLARLFRPRGEVIKVSGTALPLLASKLPTPILSRSYTALKDEYQFCFDTCAVDKPGGEVSAIAQYAYDNRGLYQKVGLSIPWEFIAIIHRMEGDGSFHTHLHNGDPLSARTKNVPSGRPLKGNPPFTWVESAKDAMDQMGFAGQSDWSVPKILYRLEAYNGFGYRHTGRPFSPYLWAGSNISTPGKFSADGKYDPAAVSKQIGAGVILKAMSSLRPLSF